MNLYQYSLPSDLFVNLVVSYITIGIYTHASHSYTSDITDRRDGSKQQLDVKLHRPALTRICQHTCIFIPFNWSIYCSLETNLNIF